MYNSKDILARLQAGEDVNLIAKEFADALNDANQKYEDQKKKEVTLQKERELAGKVAEAMNEYLNFVAPDLMVDDPGVQVSDVVDIMNTIIGTCKALKSFEDLFEKDQKAATACTKMDDDAVIQSFLNKFVK